MGRPSKGLAAPAGRVLAPASGAEQVRLAKRILIAWLAESPTGSPHTRAAKEDDLDAYASWLALALSGTPSGVTRTVSREQAVVTLLFEGFAAAQESVRGWMAWMAARQGKRARFAPATRARRLAHLRSLVRVAQEHGLPWGLQLRGPKIRPYRDASGPEAWKVYAVIAKLVGLTSTGETEHERSQSARDVAILQLLFCLGLRRQSVATLDLADLDGAAVWIRQKGEEEPRRRSLPLPTEAAIACWLRHRGRAAGPLFTGVREGEAGERLSCSQIYRIAVRHIANPHGLRHAGATKLAREGHSVFELQAHLGHSNAMTAQHYVDASEDAPGQTAAYLAEQLAALYDGADDDAADPTG